MSVLCVESLFTRGYECECHLALLRKVATLYFEWPFKVNGLGSARDFAHGHIFCLFFYWIVLVILTRIFGSRILNEPYRLG